LEYLLALTPSAKGIDRNRHADKNSNKYDDYV
jgi:hypothetical protein